MIQNYLAQIQGCNDRGEPAWPPPETTDQLAALEKPFPDAYRKFYPSDYDIRRCPQLASLRTPWKQKFNKGLATDKQFRRDVLHILSTDSAFAKAVLDVVRSYQYGYAWGLEDEF